MKQESRKELIAWTDMEQSFYVGDAAGRQDAWKLKERKDHSAGDR